MTTPEDALVPDRKDVSRALCATLATVRGEFDVLDVIAAQCASPADLQRFLAAVLSAFATFVVRKTDDPEAYLLQWIALELELADTAENAADDG